MTTKHDQDRYDRAVACDRNNEEALIEAVTGLQSTDDPDPRFKQLHDELQAWL